MTAAKLGEIVGVSESTVVRFATQLGYKGYPGFQKALEELVRNKLNSIQRMEVTYGRISQSEILETVLQSDIDKIKMTLADIDHKAFDLAIDTLLNARRVYVIGIRSCAPLASFLGFYLNLVCDNVSVVDVNSSSEIFEQLIRINEHDVIIGISFPRYSMRTLKALEFASNRKAKVITLTDSVHSPMNLYSSCNLIARSDMASIVDSLVAPLSVVNALVVALCMKRQKEVVSTLETLEEIWGEYEVYSRDELDPMKRSFSRMKRQEEKMSKVIVVGGGAAGMMAAVFAAENGHHVQIYEKNDRLGRKLFITGKGRCNITNASDVEELFQAVVSNPKFLYSAFYSFTNEQVIDFFENLGVKTKVERGNRVFPVSDHSSDIIGALQRELHRLGVQISLCTEVEKYV